MGTMKISELKSSLDKMQEKHGDVQVVLFDWDTHAYFSLTESNIEAQMMADNTKRVSIGVNYFEDNPEDHPAKRPI